MRISALAANQSMKSSRTIKVRIMNIQKELEHFSTGKTDLRFNNVEVIPEAIRAIMINEVVPLHSEEDFYGKQDAAYMINDNSVVPKSRYRGWLCAGYSQQGNLYYQRC